MDKPEERARKIFPPGPNFLRGPDFAPPDLGGEGGGRQNEPI